MYPLFTFQVQWSVHIVILELVPVEARTMLSLGSLCVCLTWLKLSVAQLSQHLSHWCEVLPQGAGGAPGSSRPTVCLAQEGLLFPFSEFFW